MGTCPRPPVPVFMSAARGRGQIRRSLKHVPVVPNTPKHQQPRGFQRGHGGDTAGTRTFPVVPAPLNWVGDVGDTKKLVGRKESPHLVWQQGARVLTTVNPAPHARTLKKGPARGSAPLRGTLRVGFDLRCAPRRGDAIATGALKSFTIPIGRP